MSTPLLDGVSVVARRVGGSLEHAATVEPGTLIAARYEVESLLGRGGMGAVYRARDRRLGRSVAIKRLSPELEGDRRGLARFLSEARAVAQLNHPNIVTVYELGDDEAGPFIVMELVEGLDLAEVLERGGAPSLAEALPLLRGIGLALSHAHARGVIHRDVKPHNVLVTQDGTPKVADFGLARVSTEGERTRTRVGHGLGTLAYMAPEQRKDARTVDPRADIYAFGKTAYHILTGEVPETLDLELVPDALRPVLRRALRTRPEDRYPNLDAMLAELETAATAAAVPAGPSRRASQEAPRTGLEPPPCPGCGRPNPIDGRFCEQCGAALCRRARGAARRPA